ncbi:MAG: CO dehydrogenase/CO-methylating acetyl-CoA synthase complex subunit beta [Thermoplasmata archaeon]|nr:MAG: CO dehydrogenase/CO-methylating acetyl-CoA synthase complex subunit beta [Thermoplasmata archaeon]
MEFPVDVGPQYEGEAIRKGEYQVEFGGPQVREKFELATLKSPDEIEDEKVEVVGPDIKDMEEGGSYPLAILVDFAGAEAEKDMEPVIERRIHMYCNYIEGFWHMAQRDDIWLRLAKRSFKKGLDSLEKIGKILIFLYKNEIMLIEKMAITFITDAEKVKELLPKAREIYRARDERIRGLKDEDVDEFYGCVLCQSFAPTHCCIIAPSRVANCGAMNWFDCRAAYKMDPEGPVFAVPKGDCLDPVKGEYSGANQTVAERSLGTYDRVFLHSAFEHPHTSCGCFQALLFYIPETDGFGIVHRDYTGETVIGRTFSSLAGDASGGRQVEGLVGIGIDYIRSPQFMQADGGLKRVMWMPKSLKEMVKEAIPEDLYPKIATEEDAKNTDELMEFVQRVGHPWITGG